MSLRRSSAWSSLLHTRRSRQRQKTSSWLWTRAEDIPAPPRVRLVFHTTVLMAAFGGFRPGTLMKLKCKDFELSLICDPDDPVHYKLVVTPTVNRNKIKKSQKISRYKIQPS